MPVGWCLGVTPWPWCVSNQCLGDDSVCLCGAAKLECGHRGAVGTGRSCGNVGKEPQMGQCGRHPCCLAPVEAGDRGWGLTAIRQPPPACTKQELLSQAGPGLAAMLGDGSLCLHLAASSSTLLKEQEFYFISTMHWAIPSSLWEDRKRSPKQKSCCCWLSAIPGVFCRTAQRGSSFSFVAIGKMAVFCHAMSVLLQNHGHFTL